MWSEGDRLGQIAYFISAQLRFACDDVLGDVRQAPWRGASSFAHTRVMAFLAIDSAVSQGSFSVPNTISWDGHTMTNWWSLRNGHPSGILSPGSPIPCGGESVVRIAIFVVSSAEVRRSSRASFRAQHWPSGPSPPAVAIWLFKYCFTLSISVVKSSFPVKNVSSGVWSRKMTTATLSLPEAILPEFTMPLRVFWISSRALSRNACWLPVMSCMKTMSLKHSR